MNCRVESYPDTLFSLLSWELLRELFFYVYDYMVILQERNPLSFVIDWNIQTEYMQMSDHMIILNDRLESLHSVLQSIERGSLHTWCSYYISYFVESETTILYRDDCIKFYRNKMCISICNVLVELFLFKLYKIIKRKIIEVKMA